VEPAEPVEPVVPVEPVPEPDKAPEPDREDVELPEAPVPVVPEPLALLPVPDPEALLPVPEPVRSLALLPVPDPLEPVPLMPEVVPLVPEVAPLWPVVFWLLAIVFMSRTWLVAVSQHRPWFAVELELCAATGPAAMSSAAVAIRAILVIFASSDECFGRCLSRSNECAKGQFIKKNQRLINQTTS